MWLDVEAEFYTRHTKGSVDMAEYVWRSAEYLWRWAEDLW